MRRLFRQLGISFELGEGEPTPITNAGLKQLKGIKRLKSPKLKGTQVTDAGMSVFKKARPNVTVTR